MSKPETVARGFSSRQGKVSTDFQQIAGFKIRIFGKKEEKWQSIKQRLWLTEETIVSNIIR